MKQNLCPIKNKKEFELTKSLPTKKEKNLSPNGITDEFYQSRNIAVSRENTSHTFESESEGEVAQSCPTLCDPIDSSLPGSAVHGIFQARILE